MYIYIHTNIHAYGADHDLAGCVQRFMDVIYDLYIQAHICMYIYICIFIFV